MGRRLARLTLNLYPLGFRRRYGEEMRALLDDGPTRLSTSLDLLRGAFAAHVRPPNGLADCVELRDRLRASTSGVLACWVAFAAAGFGFYKTTEDSPFSAAGRAHPVLGAAHVAVQLLAIVASCAVVAGALPLLIAALGRARRQPRLRRLVALPILAVVVFVALTGLLVWIAHSHSLRTNAAHGAFIAWILAGLACGAVCAVASRKALFAVSVDPRRLTSALACGTLVTAAMVAIALAAALYAIALQLDASRLAATSNGPLGNTSTAFMLIVQVTVMLGAGALATTTTLRGWRGVRRAA